MKDLAFNTKIAKRLAYLWHIRETRTRYYMEGRFYEEKENIYSMYGPDNTIGKLAHDYYYETHGPAFQAIINEGERYQYDIETDTIKSR